MKFRPCIDLHSGQVKQIVGSSLSDKQTESAASLSTNFETDRPASSYAEMYQMDALVGGHVIMLGKGNDDAVSEYTNRCKKSSLQFCASRILYLFFRQNLLLLRIQMDCKLVEV